MKRILFLVILSVYLLFAWYLGPIFAGFTDGFVYETRAFNSHEYGNIPSIDYADDRGHVVCHTINASANGVPIEDTSLNCRTLAPPPDGRPLVLDVNVARITGIREITNVAQQATTVDPVYQYNRSRHTLSITLGPTQSNSGEFNITAVFTRPDRPFEENTPAVFTLIRWAMLFGGSVLMALITMIALRQAWGNVK